MKSILKLGGLLSFAAALPASAQIIGVENFDYTDGAVANQSGGTGFDFNNLTDTATGTSSDWDATGGSPQVTGNKLVTNNSSAKREYNGPTEGGGDDDGSERSGALRGNGVVFYKVIMNRSGSALWGGVSTYDFGAERSFFGVPGSVGGTDTIGIAGGGFPDAIGFINLTDGQDYTLVCVHDFDNDRQALFVNPGPSDYYDVSDGSNSADVTRFYNATNWSTAVRLGSGGQVTWDDLQVALDPTAIGLSPFADLDVDGLPDTWELNFFGNLTQSGTDDSETVPDGLDNAGEFAAGSNPTLSDTDGDGIIDGEEVDGTNGFVTDPVLADTDGDGVNDFDEVDTANGFATDPTDADSDNDGYNDGYEIANAGSGFDPTASNSADDFDSDNLDNAGELAAGTDPLNPDTDNDGRTDGDEVNGAGGFTSDPALADTDGDGLEDGPELAAGSDPNVVDTDGGGANDFVETLAGTDPSPGNGGDDILTSSDPLPALGPDNAQLLSLIGIDYFSYYPDGPLDGGALGDFWDYDNSITNDAFSGHTTLVSDWTVVGGAPFIRSGKLVTQGGAIKREFHGGPAGAGTALGERAGYTKRVDDPNPSENANDVIYAKVVMTRLGNVDWSGVSLYDYNAERYFAGVNFNDPDGAGPEPSSFNFVVQESANGANRTSMLDDNGFPVVSSDFTDYTLVVKYDFAADTITLFLDPALDQPEPASTDPFVVQIPAGNLANFNASAIRLGSGGSGEVEWDDLVVGTSWGALDTTPIDSEEDGMTDVFEVRYGLDRFVDDSTGNPDGDSLTNLDEFVEGTDPTNDDTDGDGLEDGFELNDSFTDPRVADSDGDGLSDGDEVNVHSSNPNLVDTDNDGYDDLFEVDNAGVGFDPINDSSAGDADSDGLNNGGELTAGTDALDPDSDDDGRTDGEEVNGAGGFTSDPNLVDTDGDTISDFDEVDSSNGFITDPELADTDGDRQSDIAEIVGDGTTTSDPTNATDTVGGPVGLIGCEGFFYGDGSIGGLTGGEYWDHENLLENGPYIGRTGTVSDWDGTAVVSSGVLVTNNGTAATREYNGPSEGAGSGANPTDARLGAINQEGSHDLSVVYFKAELTRRAGATSSLLQSDDFGTPRVSFGVVEDGSFIEWGIQENGVTLNTDLGALPVNDDQTYTVVGKLDFDGDLLSLWVDPDLTDLEANNAPNVTLVYVAGNWSSGLRLTSGGTGDSEWDNVVVSSYWEDLGKELVDPNTDPVQLMVLDFNRTTNEITLGVTGVRPGDTYYLGSSRDLVDFYEVPGGTVTGDGSIILGPLDPGSVPAEFYSLFEDPLPAAP